jgi:Mlc titration factor MtfA (ptsG expression regulator)
LAFYLIGKDEMFIRADLKGHEHDAVETTIHELAHRLQFKFLDSNKHSAIKSMYRRIEDGSQGAEDAAIQKLLDDPTTKPQEGDVVVEPRKKLELVFKRLDYRHGKMVAVLKLKDESDTRANELSLSIKGWYSLKGIKLDIAKVGGFITPYAATHPDENFAEMVSAYCMGKLHPSQVEMLEAIIK